MFPSLTELVITNLLYNCFKAKRLRPESILPTRGTAGSARYDLYATVEVFIPPKGQVRVPTGVSFTTPVFTYGKVQDGSGNAAKFFLRTAAGVIDHNHTGEVDVLVGNQNSERHWLRVGDKMARLTLELHVSVEVQEVTELEVTERGAGRFESTDTQELKVTPHPR